VGVMDTPVVLSQNERTRDSMVILVSDNFLQRCRLITVRLRLVVATRLHKQFSSFWLRISSNTSSCSEESHEWNTLANPIRNVLSILQYWLENA
jgi:hypothetical protein